MKKNPFYFLFKKSAQIVESTPWKIIALSPILFSIAMIIIIFYYSSSLPPQIPLYYSRPWGEDQLADPKFLFILPLGSIIGYCANLMIIEKKTSEYRVFAQILLLFQSSMSFLALLIIVNIIRLMK